MIPKRDHIRDFTYKHNKALVGLAAAIICVVMIVLAAIKGVL